MFPFGEWPEFLHALHAWVSSTVTSFTMICNSIFRVYEDIEKRCERRGKECARAFTFSYPLHWLGMSASLCFYQHESLIPGMAIHRTIEVSECRNVRIAEPI